MWGEGMQANLGIPGSRWRAPRNDDGHFSLIGGAIFSAGAGGSAGDAPSFCA